MRLISPHRQLVLPRRGRGVWRDKKKVVGSGVVRAVLCERAKTGLIISTKIAHLCEIFCGKARIAEIAFQSQLQVLRAHLYAWSLPQHEFPFVPPFILFFGNLCFFPDDGRALFLPSHSFPSDSKKNQNTRRRRRAGARGRPNNAPRSGPTDRAPPLEGQILKTCRRCSELRA